MTKPEFKHSDLDRPSIDNLSPSEAKAFISRLINHDPVAEKSLKVCSEPLPLAILKLVKKAPPAHRAKAPEFTAYVRMFEEAFRKGESAAYLNFVESKLPITNMLFMAACIVESHSPELERFVIDLVYASATVKEQQDHYTLSYVLTRMVSDTREQLEAKMRDLRNRAN